MARARNIKPGFYKNEDLAECTIWARFIFPGLWMMADREGRLEDRPKRIKAELLPFDTQDVEPLLRELQAKGFISRYERDAIKVIQILKFKANQTPHHLEKPSVLPAEFQEELPNEQNSNPSVDLESTEKEPAWNGGSKPPDSLIPDSLNLIPDSLSPPPAGGEAAKPPSPKRAKQLPPDFYPNETGISYASQRKIGMAVELESFRNWHQSKGSTMKDWQAAWRTWCDKAVEYGRANGARASPARTESLHDKRARAMDELTGRKEAGNGRFETDSRDGAADHEAIQGEAVRVAG